MANIRVFTLKKQTVIFYHGKSNSGKTSVLKQLVKLLRDESRAYLEKKKKVESPDLWAAVYYRDFWVVIGTAGDRVNDIEDTMDFANAQQSTIVVCAARKESTKLKVSSKVASNLKNANVADILKTAFPNPSDVSDIQEAKKIKQQIDNLIVKKGANRISFESLKYGLKV